MNLTSMQHAMNHPYLPRMTEFTKPFWEGLKNGQFLTTQCQDCGDKTFPPKIVCPKCWSDNLVWIRPGITGTLYSWTRVHAGPAVFQALQPYYLGIIDLDDDIRIACPIIPAGIDICCGARIEMVNIEYNNGNQLAAKLYACSKT